MKNSNFDLSRMMNVDPKLLNVLQLLGSHTSIIEYQLVGMGWVAKILYGGALFTLHSERGWIEIYQGEYLGNLQLGCESTAEAVAKLMG